MDYGMVHHLPTGLKKGDYFMHEIFHVCRTGRKQQYYTLYREFEASLVGTWFNRQIQYLKNLSHNLEDAMEKAKSHARGAFIQYHESPRKELKRFDAFDLDWKAGRKCYFAIPDPVFWEKWKSDKDSIKEAGFWVSKSKRDNQFYVFHRILHGSTDP